MKTLKQYSEIIEKNKNNPGLLAQLNNEISADYGYCAEQMITVQLKKAQEWVKLKMQRMTKDENGVWSGKPRSDALTEQLWRLEHAEGRTEIELKYRMKALEKYMSSIKSHAFIANNEAHSQY